MASRINFVLPISPSKTKDTTKGRLIRDRGKMWDHWRFVISSAAMSKSKIRFWKSEKIGLTLQVYNMKIAGPTGLSPHRILFLRDRVSRTLPWLNHGKVARDANAMMAEADDTAAKVCKALQDEHEKRAKYFKQGKVQKYALQDTVWVERHHKDVLSRHRQASWYVPGVIVRKVGQDVYAVRVGDNKILDRDHTQLRPRAPDPSGRPVTFEFTAGDVDSDDEGEDDDFTAERILADKPDPGTPGGGAL